MAVYSRGKRAKHGQIKKGRLFTIFLLLIIICGIIYLVATDSFSALLSQEDTLSSKTRVASIPTASMVAGNTIDVGEDEISDEEIPAKMSGYKVIGKLVIDKIGVSKNILSVRSYSALNISLVDHDGSKGPDINEPGNFCIAGHNWANMLQDLKKLKAGDTFYLINRENKTKVTYEVYEVKIYNPSDTSALDQNNDGKREVTIYTCTKGGTQRVVCKAREV